MSEVKHVAFKVNGEPSIQVEAAYVWMESPDLVAIGIQTNERTVVDGSGGGDGDGPSIFISSVRNPDQMMYVELPDYPGWTVWSAEASKYTVHVCIYKPKKD